jgi:tRNA(Ile)-lysidine synthase
VASAEAAPVSPAEALSAFRPTLGRRGVGLAVSGGADSLSLLHLWADARALEPSLPDAVVLTVDHRLRAASADEAGFVAEVAAARGLSHRTLSWDGPKPAANLQAAARRARRELLRAAAEDLGLDTLLLAHHADDQAETFLLRLARGSGVVGLAAMAPARREGGLLVLRPFLDWPKARLVASLTARGARWIEDPSNADPRFERARARAAMPALAALGLDRARLVATAAAMARAAAAIATLVDELADRAVVVHPAGFVRVEAAALRAAPEEVRLRLLSRLVAMLADAPYGPRLAALERLDAALRSGEGGGAHTLAGVRVEARRGWLWLAPEAGRCASVRLAAGERRRIGGREVSLAGDAPAAVVLGPLGAAGRRALRAAGDRLDLGDPAPSAALVEGLTAVVVAGEGLVLAGLAGAAAGRVAGLRVGPFVAADGTPVTNSS